MSRGLRGCVEYGSIEYSAVSQPPVTPCSFIQRGTASSIVVAQITRVLPIDTSTEPLACGATFNSKLMGRISSGARPSLRCIKEKLNAGPSLRDEELRRRKWRLLNHLVAPGTARGLAASVRRRGLSHRFTIGFKCRRSLHLARPHDLSE